MVHGHNDLLWHDADLCECLALLADQAVLSAMLQLAGAARTASLLAVARPLQDIAALAHQCEEGQYKLVADDAERRSSFTYIGFAARSQPQLVGCCAHQSEGLVGF